MDLAKTLGLLGLDLNHPWKLLAALLSHATQPMVSSGIQDALNHRLNATDRLELAKGLRKVADDLDAGHVHDAAEQVAAMVESIRL